MGQLLLFAHSLRINIECAFGILVRKWLILGRILNCDLARAKDIITVCVILHNYTIRPADSSARSAHTAGIPSPDNSSASANTDPHWGNDCFDPACMLGHGSAVNAHQSPLRAALTDLLFRNGMVRPAPPPAHDTVGWAC